MPFTAGTKEGMLREWEMSVILQLRIACKAWRCARFNRVGIPQASCAAGDLAPRLSGTSNLQLGGGAEADAAPPAQSRAAGQPRLPKRLKARPRDMPGTVIASCCAMTVVFGGRTSQALHTSQTSNGVFTTG